MKESIGEGAMTIITILLVGAAIWIIAGIVGDLLKGQKRRTLCENAGGVYSSGECRYNGQPCLEENNDFTCG